MVDVCIVLGVDENNCPVIFEYKREGYYNTMVNIYSKKCLEK